MFAEPLLNLRDRSRNYVTSEGAAAGNGPALAHVGRARGCTDATRAGGWRQGRQHMRQAIETKYLGPTNTRGSRISVRCQAGRIIVPWADDAGVEENHRAAAGQLARKLGWTGDWYGGVKVDDSGYVFVVCSAGSFAFTERGEGR